MKDSGETSEDNIPEQQNQIAAMHNVSFTNSSFDASTAVPEMVEEEMVEEEIVIIMLTKRTSYSR